MNEISQPVLRKKMSRTDRYINSRIQQLKRDLEVAHDEMDKAWYQRLIQELAWVQHISNSHQSNLRLKSGEKEIWT